MVQQCQGGLEMRQAFRPQVQVSHGGRQVAVPEQALECRQVGPGFEQVCGVAVPQRVAGRRLGQPGPVPRLLKEALNGGHVEWLTPRAGEQPVRRSVVTPIRPQFVDQCRGQRHTAVLIPLAPTNPQDVPLAVHVRHTQMSQFADSQPATVGDP